MSVNSRLDIDLVYHNATDTTFEVGVLSEHLASTAAVGSVTGTVGTSAVSIGSTGSMSTIAVKNIGSTVLRLGGAVSIPAGRLAVIPATAVVSIASISGVGSHSSIWVG
jgi:hypothetical protein